MLGDEKQCTKYLAPVSIASGCQSFCCSQEAPQRMSVVLILPWFHLQPWIILPASNCAVALLCQTSRHTHLCGLYPWVTVTGGHSPANSSMEPNCLPLMLHIHRVNIPRKKIGHGFLAKLVFLLDWYDFTWKCAEVLQLSVWDKKEKLI